MNKMKTNPAQPITPPHITITTIDNATRYINFLRSGGKFKIMQYKPQRKSLAYNEPTAMATQTIKTPGNSKASVIIPSQPPPAAGKSGNSIADGGSMLSAKAVNQAAYNAAIQAASKRISSNNNNNIPREPEEQSLDKYRRALWNMYRDRIMAAYHYRRIFITYRNYAPVRKALVQRGWLEKIVHGRYKKIQSLPDEKLLAYARSGREYEAVAISRLLETFPAFFIWQDRHQPDRDAHLQPYRNVMRRGRNVDFTTKVGLIGCAELSDWYYQHGVSEMSYPRFYRIALSNEERFAFIKDFQFTQCVAFLRHVKRNFTDVKGQVMIGGAVPFGVLEFALQSIKRYLFELDDELIDNESNLKVESPSGLIDWNKFIVYLRDVFNRNGKFNCTYKQLFDFFLAAETYLRRVLQKFPNRRWDGTRNLWILKPAYECRGQGIVVKNDLDEIFKFVADNQREKYIVQKYIETPLLIYKAKFDIRQYMLLSVSQNKLNIWLYKDCYLRFSGQEFNLDSLHASIHLTNNSIQVNYPNSKTRDERLPSCNMWSLDQFRRFLHTQPCTSRIWDTKIYPGFRKNLVNVILASLEETELVPNTFELYGCDFMLDEDYEPIIIEINANPDLSPSTHITERLCPMVLHDLVKVIVDVPMNALAPTGQWDRVYDINIALRRSSASSAGLGVNGKAMTILPLPPLAQLSKYTGKPVEKKK